MELHDVSYGIEYVARPLLLFFSSENQLLWFRYREYDLAHLKLVFEFSIYNVWKSVQYGISNGLDMAYWGFLESETSFVTLLDILYCSNLDRRMSPLDTVFEQIPHQKKKVLGGELFTESSSKMNENENLFVPASMGYDQEMVPKTKDWVERLNPDSKLPNFNTGRVLVLESQAVNEFLDPTETLDTPESSKDSEAESLTLLPPLKNLQGASPSSEDSSNKSVSGTVTVSETKQTTALVPTEVKDTEQE
ncbi:hypothetical protein Tco_1407884 [Tanacetum coccineum]